MADKQPDPHDVRWVGGQYKTPKNLNARIHLHQRFSTNQYAWPQWVFDHLQLAPAMAVLEIGGGPGGLWDANRHRLPVRAQITVTDQSPGMVGQAFSTLGALPQLRFAQADAQALPFVAAAFDVVIANHMLYHVPDRACALREIRRVLRPTGRFFAATNDTDHLHEMRELAEDFMPGSGKLISQNERFPFAVAAQELSVHFGQVQLHRYHNRLMVTDADALADYMLSTISFMKLPAVAENPFRSWLRARMDAQGAITVTAATGMFEATTALPVT